MNLELYYILITAFNYLKCFKGLGLTNGFFFLLLLIVIKQERKE